MRRKIFTVLAAIAVFFGLGTAVNVATAMAGSEIIFNDCHHDGTDYSFLDTTSDGVSHNLYPCESTYGSYGYTQLRGFTLPAHECASVSYNYGPWLYRAPGRHDISDGAIVHVNPYKC